MRNTDSWDALSPSLYTASSNLWTLWCLVDGSSVARCSSCTRKRTKLALDSALTSKPRRVGSELQIKPFDVSFYNTSTGKWRGGVGWDDKQSIMVSQIVRVVRSHCGFTIQHSGEQVNKRVLCDFIFTISKIWCILLKLAPPHYMCLIWVIFPRSGDVFYKTECGV